MTKGGVDRGGLLTRADGLMHSIRHLVLWFSGEHQKDIHKIVYQQGQHDLIELEFWKTVNTLSVNLFKLAYRCTGILTPTTIKYRFQHKFFRFLGSS